MPAPSQRRAIFSRVKAPRRIASRTSSSVTPRQIQRIIAPFTLRAHGSDFENRFQALSMRGKSGSGAQRPVPGRECGPPGQVEPGQVILGKPELGRELARRLGHERLDELRRRRAAPRVSSWRIAPTRGRLRRVLRQGERRRLDHVLVGVVERAPERLERRDGTRSSATCASSSRRAVANASRSATIGGLRARAAAARPRSSAAAWRAPGSRGCRARSRGRRSAA